MSIHTGRQGRIKEGGGGGGGGRMGLADGGGPVENVEPTDRVTRAGGVACYSLLGFAAGLAWRNGREPGNCWTSLDEHMSSCVLSFTPRQAHPHLHSQHRVDYCMSTW